MTWNPDAILRLVDGARVPETCIMVMKIRCGGLQQIDRHCARPKILLKLEVRGKSRCGVWRRVLRELAIGGNHVSPGSEQWVRSEPI